MLSLGIRSVLLAVLLLAVPLSIPAERNDPGTTQSTPAPSPTPPGDPASTDTATAEPSLSFPEPVCFPTHPLVDAEATAAATCLAATLDRWQASSVMAVGQQLNVSTQSYAAPLRKLEPQSVAVIGFDLDELAEGESFQFGEPPLTRLVALAAEGKVLTASWHTRNPQTGQDSFDRSWTDLAALVDGDGPAAQVFWADYDEKLELLLRIQSGDDGRFPPAAVLFRPLHEANGDWFWWAQADPTTYRRLYAELQRRAAEAGVHNVVWGWSANAVTREGITDPLSLLPESVDLAGLDTYDPPPTPGAPGQPEQLVLEGLGALAGQVSRTALAEVGRLGAIDRTWDPATITRSVLAQGLRPAYALLWFDDGNGVKQLSSLRRGPQWLASCPEALCPIS